MQQNRVYHDAFQWYADHGVDEALAEEPIDRFNLPPVASTIAVHGAVANVDASSSLVEEAKKVAHENVSAGHSSNAVSIESAKIAVSCNTLDELKDAIQNFDGIGIKRTASNMVFSDGNPKARVMVIGEAPGADEDRQGIPFVGASGQLLDKILACINLSRGAETPEDSVYITNVLNWRPPGNRSPNDQEITASLPFIERHIQLIKPEFLIFLGATPAKSLLGSGGSISRQRGKFHEYRTIAQDLQKETITVPAMATYHPAHLLNTPAQKKAVWADMLMLQERLTQN